MERFKYPFHYLIVTKMVQTMTVEKEKPVEEVLETFVSKLEDIAKTKASESSIPEKLLSELENSGIIYNGKVIHDIGADIYVEPETDKHYRLINGKFEEIKINRPKSEVYIVNLEE
jgi:hypothetical protein